MVESVLWIGALVLAGVATVLLVLVMQRNRRSRSAVFERLDDRLAATHDTRGTHLERPPRVIAMRRVPAASQPNDRRSTASGDTRKKRVRDGSTDARDEPTYVVPVIEVELGSRTPPSEELVYDFVASVLEAVHPELPEDVTCSHYDVQFRFGPDGLFVSRSCLRIAVPAEMADRLIADDRFRAHDLRRAIKREDDGDEETPPVHWGDCDSSG